MISDRETGNSRGLAFIKCGTRKDFNLILAKNQCEHMGRWLNIMESANSGQAPTQRPAGSFKGETPVSEDSTTIFVGNLSFQASEDSLYKFFEGCGKVIETRIAKRDGESRGFGHVQFENSD